MLNQGLHAEGHYKYAVTYRTKRMFYFSRRVSMFAIRLTAQLYKYGVSWGWFGCFLVCASSFGQAKQPNSELQSVAIKRSKNLLIVEASVNSIQGNFVIDTGVPGLVLNSNHFRNSKRSGDGEVVDIAGRNVGAAEVRVKDFRFGPIVIPEIKARLADLSHIERSRGIQVMGLIGRGILSSCNIIVDVHENVLYLQDRNVQKGQTVPNVMFEHPILRFDFKYVNDMMLVKGRIAEKELNFCVDTGSETIVLNELLKKSVKREFHPLKEMRMISFGGAVESVTVGTVSNLSVGGLTFEKVPVLLAKPYKMTIDDEHKLDGILGYPLFTKGIIYIDFKSLVMSVYPFESTPGKAFDEIVVDRGKLEK